MATEVTTVVTHHKPHVDEVVALWLLRRFGEDIFPGVQTATIEYINPGRALPDGRNAADWEAEGKLLLGVGGGLFDEHPDAGEDRAVDASATTLVAEALGLMRNRDLRAILRYAQNNDAKGAHMMFDLAELVYAFYADSDREGGLTPEDYERIYTWAFRGLDALSETAQHDHYDPRDDDERRRVNAEVVRHRGDVANALAIEWLARIIEGETPDPETEATKQFSRYVAQAAKRFPVDLVGMARAMVLVGNDIAAVQEWAYEVLDAHYRAQKSFHSDTALEFELMHDITELSGPQGRLFVVDIIGDDPMLAKYARMRVERDYGFAPGIIVIERKSGHIAVLANQAAQYDLSGIARRIRKAELLEAGSEIPVDDEHLASPGTLHEVPEWYFEQGLWILNGSQRSQDFPVTRLALSEVLDIVVDELSWPDDEADTEK